MTVAWVFPGQGSQAVGMGRDLYAHVPAAREIFDQADDLLGISISRLCFEGPDDDLTATENAQPALVTVSIALLRALETLVPEQRGTPTFVAGHSLGEYSALVAGGALDVATALQLVRRRGELMAQADQGTMAAIIGLEKDVIDSLCQRASDELDEPVVVANDNAPGQIVISGARAAVNHVCTLAKEHKAKRAMPLKVSAAFHSPLMTQAQEGMAHAVADASIATSATPVVANVSALPITTPDDIQQELVAQVVSQVRWVDSVRAMVAQGVTTFVEIGPGNVLTGLIKRIAPGGRLINLRTVDDIRSFSLAQS